MTTQERSLERQMKVLDFLAKANRPLRLQAFDPLLNRVREAGDWRLFPLSRTTVKSTLITLVKYDMVCIQHITLGKREIIHYSITDKGRAAWQAWSGA